jgi:uncharacterized protein
MYDKMFQFAKDYLVNDEAETIKVGKFPFRKRSEHIKRVFMWAQRIADGEAYINKEAVLVAAIFHDIGYAISLDGSKHAEESAIICEKYLKENGYDTEFTSLVSYLVRSHSNKELMTVSDTPLELILLMEADLLDETGALSVVWDCMMEGSEQIQTFDKTYNHIMNYSYKSLNINPMVTAKSKAFWENKQNLMKEFIDQLSFDLGICEGMKMISKGGLI